MLVVVGLVVWSGGFSDETDGRMAGRARAEESGRAVLLCMFPTIVFLGLHAITLCNIHLVSTGI